MNNEIKFTLRMDEQLFEELRFIAKEKNRSINKQIEYIIKKYVEENIQWQEKSENTSQTNKNAP